MPLVARGAPIGPLPGGCGLSAGREAEHCGPGRCRLLRPLGRSSLRPSPARPSLPPENARGPSLVRMSLLGQTLKEEVTTGPGR